MDRNQTYSRRAIEAMIADGHLIVIFEGRALKLDGWLEKHPGGKLSIKHMVGRDATDEINIYHSATTLKQFGAYRIGFVSEPWSNFTPPIRGGHFRRFGEETKEKNEDSCSISADDDDSDSQSPPSSLASKLASLNSSSTSLELLTDEDETLAPSPAKQAQLKASRLFRRQVGHAAMEPAAVRVEHIQTREEFVDETVEKEIQDAMRDFPSLDPITQRAITERYRALHERVKQEGFYDCRYVEYGKECLRYTALFSLFLVALRYEWYICSALFLAFFWQQIMFTAHDAGHRGITHHFVADTLIAIFIADLCCGLSMGWWKSSHNVHHLVTNDPAHDPDIQNAPLFATAPAFFRSLASSYYDGFVYAWDAAADRMVPYQRYTYYPVMAIARFNLYLLSWLHILSPRSAGLGRAAWIRPAEFTGMAIYWYLYGYLLVYCSIPTWTLRVAFVLISHLATFPLHVQITLSHWGMSTADLGATESFPQRQLRTTMDVQCPAWLDWLHGGLQFQAVHHLFPRVPRHNLRALQVLVREFAEETGLRYSIYGFVEGNGVVLSRLEEVAQQVRLMAKCQEYMVETGESGLH